MIRADVSAPGSEEIDESVPYKSHETRKVERQFIETRAQLKIQADQISAEVSARIEQGDELTSRLDIQSDQISARVTKPEVVVRPLAGSCLTIPGRSRPTIPRCSGSPNPVQKSAERSPP